MDRSEPPSRPQSNAPLLIGRNSRGNWVVRDLRGLCGGLFINRAEALRFALFENGHRPQSIIMIPGTLELRFGDTAPAATSTSKTESKVTHQVRSFLSGRHRGALALAHT
jgi:hypothetical protein